MRRSPPQELRIGKDDETPHENAKKKRKKKKKEKEKKKVEQMTS